MKKLKILLWDKGVIAMGTGLVIILSVIDYSKKLGILKFLFDMGNIIFIFLISHFSYILIFISIVWIFILSIKLKKITIGNTIFVSEERLQKIEKDQSVIRSNILQNHKLVIDDMTKIKGRVQKLEEDNYYIKRETLKIEIERYEKENQNGAILCRIQLLDLDMAKGFEFRIHETLEDILNYVKSHTLFSQSAADLKKQLSKLSPEYDLIRGQIETQIKI